MTSKLKSKNKFWSNQKYNAVNNRFVMIAIISSYAIVGGLVGLLAVNAYTGNTDSPNQNQINLLVTDNDVSLRVSDVKINIKGVSPFDAPDGMSFVTMNVTIENKSNTIFYFAPVVQTYVTDANGQKYELSPTSLDNPIQAGEISSGRTVNGEISFLVPNNATGLTFNFKPSETSRIYTSSI